jgi:hypothetical protein
MDKERAIILLNDVVNYISIANDTCTQIEILSNIGFTKEDFLFFGYDKADIDHYYKEFTE